MQVKAIVAEDFINYKRPCMFISTCYCTWKCCTEQNVDVGVCQNAPLATNPSKDISDQAIYEQFINNPITKGVVIGGLEPFLQFNELYALIKLFRENKENCPFIIYTGYYPEEIESQLSSLKKFHNIIVKFGRYIVNDTPRFDEILGVTLASSNQYAEVIS